MNILAVADIKCRMIRARFDLHQDIARLQGRERLLICAQTGDLSVCGLSDVDAGAEIDAVPGHVDQLVQLFQITGFDVADGAAGLDGGPGTGHTDLFDVLPSSNGSLYRILETRSLSYVYAGFGGTDNLGSCSVIGGMGVDGCCQNQTHGRHEQKTMSNFKMHVTSLLFFNDFHYIYVKFITKS